MADAPRKDRDHVSREPSKQRREQLLDVKAAAEMLGVAPSTIYQWSYERRIPSVKLGGSLRFRLSDLERLIRSSVRPALREHGAGDDEREQ